MSAKSDLQANNHSNHSNLNNLNNRGRMQTMQIQAAPSRPASLSSRRRVSAKSITRSVSVLMAGTGLCRAGVLYLESLAEVRSDRQADVELLELCAAGAARGSIKMREACLKAQADRAAPVFLKAILHAHGVVWRELSDTCGSPLKFAFFLIFLLSAIIMPALPWIKMLSGGRQAVVWKRGRGRGRWAACDDDDDSSSDEDDGHHAIEMAMAPSRQASQQGIRRRLGRLLTLSSSANNTRVDERRMDAMERQRSSSFHTNDEGDDGGGPWITLGIGSMRSSPKLHEN